MKYNVVQWSNYTKAYCFHYFFMWLGGAMSFTFYFGKITIIMRLAVRLQVV